MHLSEDALGPLNRTQRGLLDRYGPLVKPGGRLVYATCSLLERENQGVIGGFLRDHAEFTPIPVREILSDIVLPSSPDAGDFLELLPHRTTTDGFFGAVMVRKP